MQLLRSLLLIATVFALLCPVSCNKNDEDGSNGGNEKHKPLEEVDDVCTMMDDATFMRYCYDNFDVNKDGKVSMTEAAAIKDMSISKISELHSLKGIEYFTTLNRLNLSSSNIKIDYLDLSQNSLLTIFTQSNKSINRLSLPKSIKELSCSYLPSVDLSSCSKLEKLVLSNLQMNSLDLSKNTSLTSISLGYNNYIDSNERLLSSVVLPKSSSLKSVNINYSQLTSLDVSNNTSLESLSLTNNKITSINLSKNTALKEINLSKNQLTTIDLSRNNSLKNAFLSDNQISSINLPQNGVLEELYVDNNRLSSVDISKSTSLLWFKIDNNQLTSLDLSNNKKLEHLRCYGNNISMLDISMTNIFDDGFVLYRQRSRLRLAVTSAQYQHACRNSGEAYIQKELQEDNIELIIK